MSDYQNELLQQQKSWEFSLVVMIYHCKSSSTQWSHQGSTINLFLLYVHVDNFHPQSLLCSLKVSSRYTFDICNLNSVILSYWNSGTLNIIHIDNNLANIKLEWLFIFIIQYLTCVTAAIIPKCVLLLSFSSDLVFTVLVGLMSIHTAEKFCRFQLGFLEVNPAQMTGGIKS